MKLWRWGEVHLGTVFPAAKKDLFFLPKKLPEAKTVVYLHPLRETPWAKRGPEAVWRRGFLQEFIEILWR